MGSQLIFTEFPLKTSSIAIIAGQAPDEKESPPKSGEDGEGCEGCCELVGGKDGKVWEVFYCSGTDIQK